MQLNELQRFIKNFFFRILSTILTLLLTIFTTKYLSKTLLPSGFGEYNFLVTYTSYFIFFTSLGVDIVAIRMIAADRNRIKEIFGAMAALKMILSVSAFVLMLLPILFWKDVRVLGWSTVVFAATVLPVPFSVQCVFEATKRMEFPSIIAIVAQAVNYVLIIIFVHSPGDLLIVGIITVAYYVVIFISHNIIFIKNYGMWRPTINIPLWKELLQSGIIIGLNQIIVNMIHYFNIFLIKLLKPGYHELGIFSAAYRVMFMILMVIGIFHNLMTPILFENYKLNKEKYNTYFDHFSKFMIYVGYLVAVCALFLAEPLLKIFYDLSVYNGTVVCFQILIISFFFMSINSSFNTGLLTIHREKTLLWIISIQFVMNIIGNVVLIPRFGVNGSAIATVLTEATGVAFYISSFKKYAPAKVSRKFITATLSAIPAGLFLYFVNINFILAGIVAAIIMLFFAVLLRGYTIDELLHIKRNLLTSGK